LPNGKDENGREMSDHEMLVRVDDRLDQLIPRIDRLDVAIRGDGTEENPGISSMCRLHRQEFRAHLKDHAKTTKRLGLIASVLGAASGLIVELAHRLGLL